MQTDKDVTFTNEAGDELSGRLHTPQGAFRGAALFAHCFTCSKEILAAKHISTQLAAKGIAVLRFDFTGLGQSGGAFADTSFASNLGDLKCAAAFMAKQKIGSHSLAPEILVGHSLGGAAVLAGAPDIPSVKAIATIGAPAEPGHVLHLFGKEAESLKEGESTKVDIGGRPFDVGAQLIHDLKDRLSVDHVARLKHDILILHAPRDTVVGIENAAMIFQAARHPKSFISLDKADHLLSGADDRLFAAEMIASWAGRCLGDPKRLAKAQEGEVFVASSPDGAFAHNIAAGPHQMRADEPGSIAGGLDSGPPPYDFLLAGLGACTAMTLRMYAARKKWPLEDVDVHLTHAKVHADDADESGRLDRMERRITLRGELDDEQRARLLEIADKCPVHKSLEAGVKVATKLSDA